jgi:hypothetical protein
MLARQICQKQTSSTMIGGRLQLRVPHWQTSVEYPIGTTLEVSESRLADWKEWSELLLAMHGHQRYG